MTTMYYFGPWDRAGRYLHDEKLSRIWPGRIGPWPPAFLDGGLLLKDKSEPEGLALLWHVEGWTALAFWDRTLDTRMASCSVYLADQTLTFDEIVALAKVKFKDRWDKMKFEVRLHQPQERSKS